MKNRLHRAGGNQDGRIVKGKLKSLQSALWTSYQGEWIWFNNKQWRCLINPEKLTEEYDQKVISIEYDSEMHPGDVFYWNRTGKWWIVYTAHEEEEAYFRARIRKCDYQIEVNDNKYWIWLRGPVETSLVWRQKHSIEFNDLNYSLELYITKNDETNEFFQRHQIVKFDGHNWKVAAVDRYSQDGIIEVFLEEYFDNDMEDEKLVPEIIIPIPEEPYIDGPQEVQPYDTDVSYSIVNSSGGTFVVNSNKVKVTQTNEYSCILDVTTGKSGDFNIIYKSDGLPDVGLNVRIKSF